MTQPKTELVAPGPRTYGPITMTDLVRYVGASGDLNPVHHDVEYAQRAGYRTAFTPGMFQAGLLASWATSWLGSLNIRRYRARFKEIVYLGDSLTCSGQASRIYVDACERRVDLELTCTTQTGAVAVEGFAIFVLKRPPASRGGILAMTGSRR